MIVSFDTRCVAHLHSALIWIRRTYNSPLIYCMIAKIDCLVCWTTSTRWSPWHSDSTESTCHCDRFCEGFRPDLCTAYRRLAKTDAHAYSGAAKETKTVSLGLADRRCCGGRRARWRRTPLQGALTIQGLTVKLLFTKFNWTRVVCTVNGCSLATKTLSDKFEYVCVRVGLRGILSAAAFDGFEPAASAVDSSWNIFCCRSMNNW